MAPTVEEWWYSIPSITKSMLVAILGTTVASTFNIVSPADLYLDFDLVLRGQIWRLLTCLIYLGPIGLNVLVQLFIISRYSSMLETGHFTGPTGKADFVFMLFIGTCTLYLLSIFLPGLYFLGPPLVTQLIYIWSRKDPYGQVAFFGFRFSMWQLPFVLMVFHVLMGGSVFPDLAGILAGHVYHFSSDIIPKVYGLTIIKTPAFLCSTFDSNQAPFSRTWRTSGRGYRLNE